MSDRLSDMFTFEIADERDAIFLSPPASTDPDNWHRLAAELRRDDPVHRVEQEMFEPFYALTRHDDVFEVSRRHDIWNNTRHSVLMPDFQQQLLDGMGFTPHTLVHMDGAEHTGHRKVTNDWFKPAGREELAERHRRHRGRVRRRSSRDFDGECDFARDIAVPYTLHVIMSIFGIPRDDERRMLELTQGMFGAADPEFMGDMSDPFQTVIGHHRPASRSTSTPSPRTGGVPDRRPGHRDRHR